MFTEKELFILRELIKQKIKEFYANDNKQETLEELALISIKLDTLTIKEE